MPRLNYKIILLFLAILLAYYLLRLQNLQSIPIFGDEAIYLRWSQLIKNVDTLKFVPLSDGKQPLYMWLTAVLLKFIPDPLMAGRLLSVIFGSLAVSTIFVIGLLFFNLPVAFISSLVYLFLPFSFFFDRLALPDNQLSFLGVLSLLFSLLLAKYPRLDLSFILGAVLGISWLTKSPAIYFIFLSFITFLFRWPKNLKRLYFPIISSIIAFLIYNILRLGPQFSQIAIRNLDYVWSFSELLKHPLDPLKPHLFDIFHLYRQYISFPLITVGLAGFVLSREKLKINLNAIVIFLWWILPLLANAIMAKTFTARYILYTLPSFILLLSLGVYYFLIISRKFFQSLILKTIIILICIFPNLFWIYRISYHPFTVNLPSTETGYISDWTSGWGIKSASQYLINRSQYANIIVGTEGYFGTLPDGLQIYTDSLKQLTVFGVGIDLTQIPEKLINARNYGDEVYLLINQSRLKLTSSEQSKVSLIESYPKPNHDFLLLYRLN